MTTRWRLHHSTIMYSTGRLSEMFICMHLQVHTQKLLSCMQQRYSSQAEVAHNMHREIGRLLRAAILRPRLQLLVPSQHLHKTSQETKEHTAKSNPFSCSHRGKTNRRQRPSPSSHPIPSHPTHTHPNSATHPYPAPIAIATILSNTGFNTPTPIELPVIQHSSLALSAEPEKLLF